MTDPATTDRTAPGAVPGETFTPGSWHRYAEHLRGGRFFVVTRPLIAGTDEEVHDSIDIHEDDNGEADTALIAAAPDLFAALKWFIDDIDGTHTVMTEFDAAVSAARRALSRATEQGVGEAGRDGEER